MSRKYNVPGNVGYDPNVPSDYSLHATGDYYLRGYWWVYDITGQLSLVTDQSNIDGVTVDLSSPAVPEIVVDDSSTTATLTTDPDGIPVFTFKLNS